MGFRSTLTTEHYGGELPQWFKNKYNDILHFDNLLLSSKCEVKMYSFCSDLFDDYQKVLIEVGLLESIKEVNCVVLHEDGIVNKVVIGKDYIKYFHLEESYEVDNLWCQQY